MNKSCARQDDLADAPPMAANFPNAFSVQIPANQTSVTNTIVVTPGAVPQAANGIIVTLTPYGTVQ
jgi:hypothetical protein